MNRLGGIGLASICLASLAASASRTETSLFYVGTQLEGLGNGIWAATLDRTTGRLGLVGLSAEIDRPTWLVANPARTILYSVQATGFDKKSEAAVHAFAIDKKAGSLRRLSRVGSGGGGATHFALAPDGRSLFVANYAQGRMSAITVSADGTLGPIRAIGQDTGSGPHKRQAGPHAHGVAIHPRGRVVAVADLGADNVFFYKSVSSSAQLGVAAAPLQFPAGSGPRHLTFSHDGRSLFVLTELSAEIFAFRCRKEVAACRQVARYPLDSETFAGERSAAELLLAANGRHLYVSNRGEDLLHVFKVDMQHGTLREIQRVRAGGTDPWTFAIAPGGRWLVVADQGSDNLASFAIDPATGRLRASGASLKISKPVALAFIS